MACGGLQGARSNSSQTELAGASATSPVTGQDENPMSKQLLNKTKPPLNLELTTSNLDTLEAQQRTTDTTETKKHHVDLNKHAPKPNILFLHN